MNRQYSPDVLRRLAAQGMTFTTPDIDASGQSFTSGDWDSGDAVASYPNDLDDYSEDFLLIPSNNRDAKSEYKLPIRETHGGAIHEDALIAAIAAINGARGGLDSVDVDTLRSAYNEAVDLAVAAGVYEDADEAPAFDPPGVEAADAKLTVDGTDQSATVECADSGNLTGVVWAAGTHTLHINGRPTEVFVPEDTVRETFEHLQQNIEAGQPPAVGVDHFDGLQSDHVPVAADTGLLEIGEGTDFELTDNHQIVMTESDLTNPQAQQVAASGGFEGLDYSIVGPIRLEAGENGRPKTNEDGALVVDTVRINRVDVVESGAVDSASVGNVPQLAASAASIAASSTDPGQHLPGTLRATAEALQSNTTTMGDFDPESFDDLEAALDTAADVIDDKDERINELEAQTQKHKTKANAFDQVAAALGVEPEDEDDTVSAQAVVDAQTEDLRREIARMEASLPGYDVDGDEDVEDRAEALAGNSPQELEAIRGNRATEILNTDAEYSQRNTAVPGQSGRIDASTGQGASDEEANELAEAVMAGKDVIEARQTDQDPADFIEAKYGEDPAEYSTETELRAAINGGGD